MLNPFAFGLYIKAFFACVAVGFAAYLIGHWKGDGHGYQRRDIEIADERRRVNEQLEVLNALLDEAQAKLEAGRERAASEVASSLKDIAPALRARCAKDCSVPASTRETLEAIR